MMMNETIAEMIWLSVMADAKRPIEMNMKAMKKKTMMVPKEPMPNVPPKPIVTKMWIMTLRNMTT